MDKDQEDIFLSALEQNKRKLLRICSVYAKDDEDSKDLFQEVLIHIWQSMPRFNNSSSIGTWMFRITLNVCLRFRWNGLRKQNRFQNIDSITIANIKSEEPNSDQNDRLLTLRNCIKNLNESDKAVVALYLEELPYKEISTITGITENTIAVKVKRIKEKLLNCINLSA